MSKITAGQVETPIGYTLVPTLDAATRISRQFTGIDAAIKRVLTFDVDAFAAVVIAGAGLKDGPAKNVPAKVWGAMPELVGPLTDYLLILRNGGRPLDEAKEEAEDEGNAES